MATARVLVVDDEPSVVQFVSRALAAQGYQILPATSPRQALEIISGGAPVDLIVSDIVMPEMAGPELVREVRRLSPSPPAALLISGFAGRAELPADVPFLQKPFSPADLLAAVTRALSESAKARERSVVSRQTSRWLQAEHRQLRSELKDLEQAVEQTMKRSEEVLGHGRTPKEPRKDSSKTPEGQGE